MGINATLQALASLPREEYVAYLEVALLEPFEEIQSAAFRLLTDPQGLNRSDIVVRNFPALLPAVRRKVVEQKWHFIPVARDQIRGGAEKTRRAAYEMLAAIGEVDVAHLLALAVNDASTVIRDNAADALEKIALRYHYHLLNWRTREDEKSRQYVEQHRALMIQALEILLRTWQIHRKNLFLEIAVEMGPSAYRLLTDLVLSKPEAPVYESFLEVLGRATSDVAMELLFRLLFEHDENLRQAALRVMRERQDAAFPIALASWFARLPPDRFLQLSTRVREIPWWRTVEQNPDLDPMLSFKLIDFVSKSFVEPRTRDTMIRSLSRSRHPEVRARVLLTLRELRSPQTLECAKEALADASDDVKVVGAKVLVDLAPPDKARLLAPHLRAAHPELRTIAVREVSRESFERYIRSFDRMDPRTREIAAKALAKIDASMLDRVVDEINSMEPERRVKALQIVDYVQAGENLRPILLELLNDRDTRVRATVVKIVQLSGNVEGMKLLLAALSDPDRRVRANAIETFEQLGDERFATLLLPFLQDPDNRVRANAAKALWNLGRKEVRATIEEMLLDADENMRLSAVWTVGELAFEGAIPLLESRLEAETADKVRAKIADVLGRLRAGGAA